MPRTVRLGAYEHRSRCETAYSLCPGLKLVMPLPLRLGLDLRAVLAAALPITVIL
jgi:hypothetical protein